MTDDFFIRTRLPPILAFSKYLFVVLKILLFLRHISAISYSLI